MSGEKEQTGDLPEASPTLPTWASNPLRALQTAGTGCPGSGPCCMYSHRDELYVVPTLLVESACGLPSSALVSREAFLEEMTPVLSMKVLGKMGEKSVLQRAFLLGPVDLGDHGGW